jgi:dipeptidyl aminopeptidase/acylaminoacyl peptidase
MLKFIFLLFIFTTTTVFSQTIPNNSPLSIKEIMKGNEFVGNLPESIRWSVDGQTILFEWNPKNELGNSTYAYLNNGKANLPAKADPKSIFEFDLTQRNNLINYYSIEGALVAYNKKTKISKLIYQSSSSIYNIQRTKLENIICFQQENNLYSYNAIQGTIVQLTNFQSGEEKPSKKDDSFVTKEEGELFQFLQDKKERKDWSAEQETTIYAFPNTYYFGEESIENIQISPDNRFVGFRLSDYPKEKETHVENHISTNGHTFASLARAKVSDEDPSHRLGIYSIEQDSVFIIDFSKLSDIRKKPSYLNDASLYEKDRKIVMHSMKFSSANSFAVCDIRAYDNKDRWIVLIDLTTKEVFEIDHQHDEAWIGGPGINGWNAEEGTLGWLNDGQTVYFQSEESGYSHLYTYSIKLKEKRQLTSGKWEVHNVQLSNDGSKFYITCNRSHPGNRDFLRYDIIPQKMVPILTNKGFHDVVLSPDEKTLAVRYSYKNKPWELYTALNVANTKLTQITFSTTKAFNDYKWIEPEVVTFKGSDGIDVYARVYNPTGNKNKAAVIFVHGAGYLQNAHNYWSNYYREYMFHNLLVDNGFTVLDIDYRASEGYGRDYRTAIYRHMGGRDLQDHLDGKDFLVNNFGIDSSRIGIYGGSYGGFISLMAMLTTPTEFPCAAALRSVADWAHYNHEYTSNILNYPGTDTEAYKKSSPIYYANQLQGKLLMLHGMVDDNVQFQDVVRLSQRFIELGKENWELAVFPVEAHGFKESYSWNDEYRRIYELFYTELIVKHAK